MHIMWDWDEDKRQTNRAKHGVDFAELEWFEWSTAVVRADVRLDYGEHRWTALGKIAGRIHHLAFTRRNGLVRVISLRKANKREQREWESQNA
jgi:uncharacterized protein